MRKGFFLSCLAFFSIPHPMGKGRPTRDRALTDPGQFDEFVTDIRVRNQLTISRFQFHKQMLMKAARVILHVVTLCTVWILYT